MKNILKFIEIVSKCENDFEISEFYRVYTFPKSWKMRLLFLKIFKIPGKSENYSRRGSCPPSSPSGNLVDGLPLVAICDIGREDFNLNDILHLSYSSVTF